MLEADGAQGKALNEGKGGNADALSAPDRTWKSCRATVLPGALAGRAFRPDLGGPAVVAIRADGVFDVTRGVPDDARSRRTAADPAAALRAAAGERIGALADILANTPPDGRDPAKPWLLAPVDLQAIKAAGVTFVTSMLERVIEERARGNPDSAARIRAEMGRLVGDDLRALKPGSAEAERLKAALIAEGAWSQYLEVGIGAGRRDLHQGAADVGGRLRRRRRLSRPFALEQPGARGGADRRLRRAHRRRDARQRRQPARFRGPQRAAARQGEGPERQRGARAVRALLRRHASRSTTCARWRFR